jgi:hypothetical protein
MVAPRNVPIHPLSDYGTEMSAGQQFFIGRFEHSISNKPNRLRLHRHTYYEVFWVDGRGGFFANFREYLIAGPSRSTRFAPDLLIRESSGRTCLLKSGRPSSGPRRLRFANHTGGTPGDAAKSYLYAIQNSYVNGQTIIVMAEVR